MRPLKVSSWGFWGFLLVHVLNEKENLDVHMTPGFVALFALMFPGLQPAVKT